MPGFDRFPNNRLGDGVNINDRPWLASFPFLGRARSGGDSRDIDPREAGCPGGC